MNNRAMFNESAARRLEPENKPEQPHRLDDREAEGLLERVDFEELQQHLTSKKAGEKDLFDVSLLRALARLTVELRDRLLEYQTILSDDTGGRLPSLLFRRLAQLSRPEEQSAAPQTFFIAGGRDINRRLTALREFLTAQASTMGKTLLVTEIIATGESIDKIADILRQQGVDFDVAAVSVVEGAPKPDDLRYGTVGDEGFGLWSKNWLSGVEKPSERDNPHPVPYSMQNREGHEGVTTVRKDIEKIAQAFTVLLK